MTKNLAPPGHPHGYLLAVAMSRKLKLQLDLADARYAPEGSVQKMFIKNELNNLQRAINLLRHDI